MTARGRRKEENTLCRPCHKKGPVGPCPICCILSAYHSQSPPVRDFTFRQVFYVYSVDDDRHRDDNVSGIIEFIGTCGQHDNAVEFIQIIFDLGVEGGFFFDFVQIFPHLLDVIKKAIDLVIFFGYVSHEKIQTVIPLRGEIPHGWMLVIVFLIRILVEHGKHRTVIHMMAIEDRRGIDLSGRISVILENTPRKVVFLADQTMKIGLKMTIETLITELTNAGFNAFYGEAPDGTECPYASLATITHPNFAADNQTFAETTTLNLRLVESEVHNWTLISTLEELLKRLQLPYNATDLQVPSEHVCEMNYEIRFLGGNTNG